MDFDRTNAPRYKLWMRLLNLKRSPWKMKRRTEEADVNIIGVIEVNLTENHRGPGRDPWTTTA